MTGGTDNHIVLLDVAAFGLTGRQAESALLDAGVVTNRNSVPRDPNGAWYTSGVRLGTPALTTRGFGHDEFDKVAELIVECSRTPTPGTTKAGDPSKASYVLADGVADRVQGRRRRDARPQPALPGSRPGLTDARSATDTTSVAGDRSGGEPRAGRSLCPRVYVRRRREQHLADPVRSEHDGLPAEPEHQPTLDGQQLVAAGRPCERRPSAVPREGLGLERRCADPRRRGRVVPTPGGRGSRLGFHRRAGDLRAIARRHRLERVGRLATRGPRPRRRTILEPGPRA